ncbi:unnamed protein product [Lampetra fluviatilis]
MLTGPRSACNSLASPCTKIRRCTVASTSQGTAASSCISSTQPSHSSSIFHRVSGFTLLTAEPLSGEATVRFPLPPTSASLAGRGNARQLQVKDAASQVDGEAAAASRRTREAHGASRAPSRHRRHPRGTTFGLQSPLH